MSRTTPSTLQIERTDLRYLLNLVKMEIKREINCHAIGTIQSFDPLTATASVTFTYKKVLKKRNAISPVSNSYSDVIIDYPVLVRVPIVVLSGGGAYTTYPIQGTTYNEDGSINQTGDTCLLMFCDRDIDLWFELGGVQNPPNTERMHDLSDAVALVGLNPITKPIQNYSIDSVMTVFGQVIMKFTNLIASIIDSTGQRLCQSGFLQAYAGSSAPSGWLLCYGQSVSKTTYPNLFSVIGYTYGGSGANFNVPDLRGRTVAGIDNMGGTSANVLTNAFNPNRNTLGGPTGQEAHQLTIPEMPAHTHTYTYVIAPGAGDSGGALDTYAPNVTGSTGGDQPHQNVQPTMMINWIIKL